MLNSVNSIVIADTDNVATALVELLQGDVGRFRLKGRIVEVPVMESIPQYHKFAICSIRENEPVFKYGEVIGRAVCSISSGEHVHEHNITGPGREGA